MSKGRIASLLNQTAPANDPVTGLLLAHGKTVPTDGASGYETGCVFAHIDGGEGTAFYVNEGTRTSADFNAMATLTAAQEALLGATAGTVEASKAVIVDANKDAGDFRNLDAVNIDAGASGAAGSVDVFPTTAAKGKFTLSCDDQTGDTAFTLKPAAHGQATTVSIQDSGLATASIHPRVDHAIGTGADGANMAEHWTEKRGSIFYTQIWIDLTGLNSGGAANDIIGEDAGVANCHFGRVLAATHGTVFAGRVTTVETPAGGDTDVDVYASTDATGAEDADVTALAGTGILLNSGGIAAGDLDLLTALPAANEYIYLAGGTGGDATYTAGIVLIELWGK